jgi:hypothetical protein
MPQPVLNLGDIGFVRERVGRGRGPQRMHAEAGDLAADAGFEAVFEDDIAVDRCRIEVPVKITCAVVLDGPEQGPVHIAPMAGERQIVLDRAQGGGVHRHKAYLVALALDAEMHDALAALQVFHP